MSRRQHGYRYPRPAATDPFRHNRNVRFQKRFRRAVLDTITAFQILGRIADRTASQFSAALAEQLLAAVADASRQNGKTTILKELHRP